jgi:acetone carboxylase gamma subunit
MRGARAGRSDLPEARPSALPDGATRIGESLALLADGAVACARCQAVIASDGQNYKERAVSADRDLLQLGLVWVAPSQFIDEPVILREYSCPGCGTLLDCEVTRPADPLLSDRVNV